MKSSAFAAMSLLVSALVSGVVHAAPPVAAPAPPAASAPAPPTAAAPSDVEQARLHFTQATKLYKDGDFDAALVQFERAYEVKPHFKVLYNIGQTYFQLRQYVEARDAMQRYVREGGTQIDAERLAAVSKDLADLEKRIAYLTVTANVTSAAVLVDGKKVGNTPLTGPVPVSEGQRTISVEAPNRGVLQRLVRVAGGERQALDLQFAPAPVAAAAGPNPPAAGAKSRLGAAFWTTAIGAVVLGAGAGVTGYVALKANRDNQDQLKRPNVAPSELDDSNSRAKTFALTTDILGGAAIVCAGVATVLWLSTPSESAPQVGLRVGPSAASLVGQF